MTEVINVEPLSPFENPTVLSLTSNQSVPANSRYTVRVSSNTSDWILTVPTGRTHRIQNEGANQFRVAYQPSGVFQLTPGSEIEVNWNSANNTHETQVVASTEFDNVVTSGSSNAPKSSAVYAHVTTEVSNAAGTPIVDTVAAIRAFSTAPERIIARGHTTANDGGGGVFRRVVASGTVLSDDDGGWHIRNTATGALYARESTIATPEMFGAFRGATVTAAAAMANQATNMQKFFSFIVRRGDFSGWTYHTADAHPKGVVPNGYYRCDSPMLLTVDLDSDWLNGPYPASIEMLGAVLTLNTIQTEGFIIDKQRNDGKSRWGLRAVKQLAGDGKTVWNGNAWPDLYRDPAAYTAWSGSTQLFLDDYVTQVIVSGETVLYKVTVAGVSGGAAPTHSTGSAANGAATLLALGTITTTAGLSANRVLARSRDIGVSIHRLWEDKHGLDIETFGYTVGISAVARGGNAQAIGWNEIRCGQQIACKFGVVVASYLYDEGVANQAARLAMTGLPVGFKVRQDDDVTNDYIFNGPLGTESTAGNWSTIIRDITINWVNENYFHAGLIYARGNGTFIATTKSVYGIVSTDFNAGYNPSGNQYLNVNVENAGASGNSESVHLLFYAGTESYCSVRNDSESGTSSAKFVCRPTRALESNRNYVRTLRSGQFLYQPEWRLEEHNGRINNVEQTPYMLDRIHHFECHSLISDVVFSGKGNNVYFTKTGIHRFGQSAPEQFANAGSASNWQFDIATKSFNIPIRRPITVYADIPDNINGDVVIEMEAYLADSTGWFRPSIRIVNPVTGAIGAAWTRTRLPVSSDSGNVAQPTAIDGHSYFTIQSDMRGTLYFTCDPFCKRLVLGIYGNKIVGYRVTMRKSRNGRLYAPGKELAKYPGPITGSTPEWGIYQAPSRVYYADQTGANQGVYLNKASLGVDYYATSGNTSGIVTPVTYQWGHDGSGTVRIWNGTTWDDVISGVQTLDPADWVAF